MSFLSKITNNITFKTGGGKTYRIPYKNYTKSGLLYSSLTEEQKNILKLAVWQSGVDPNNIQTIHINKLEVKDVYMPIDNYGSIVVIKQTMQYVDKSIMEHIINLNTNAKHNKPYNPSREEIIKELKEQGFTMQQIIDGNLVEKYQKKKT